MYWLCPITSAFSFLIPIFSEVQDETRNITVLADKVESPKQIERKEEQHIRVAMKSKPTKFKQNVGKQTGNESSCLLTGKRGFAW